MIIIDSNEEIWKELNDRNLVEVLNITRLDHETYSLAQGLENDLTLVHSTLISDGPLSEKLKRCFGVIVFGDDDKDYSLSSILGTLNSRTQTKVFKNLIDKLEQYSQERQVFKSQMLTINSELNEVMENFEEELSKVRRIHELYTPKRLNQFKGIKISSKYSVGENVGGEFFDFHKGERKLLLVLSSSNSYLISNTIIKLFSEMKEAPEVSSSLLDLFYENLVIDVDKINRIKNSTASYDLCLLVLDLNQLSLDGFIQGDFLIQGSKSGVLYQDAAIKGKDPKKRFKASLNRGERVIINSPGLNQAWRKSEKEHSIEELLNNGKISGIDVLDELFFQIRKDSNNLFLEQDATSIMLEVNKNVIHEA